VIVNKRRPCRCSNCFYYAVVTLSTTGIPATTSRRLSESARLPQTSRSSLRPRVLFQSSSWSAPTLEILTEHLPHETSGCSGGGKRVKNHVHRLRLRHPRAAAGPSARWLEERASTKAHVPWSSRRRPAPRCGRPPSERPGRRRGARPRGRARADGGPRVQEAKGRSIIATDSDDRVWLTGHAHRPPAHRGQGFVDPSRRAREAREVKPRRCLRQVRARNHVHRLLRDRPGPAAGPVDDTRPPLIEGRRGPCSRRARGNGAGRCARPARDEVRLAGRAS